MSIEHGLKIVVRLLKRNERHHIRFRLGQINTDDNCPARVDPFGALNHAPQQNAGSLPGLTGIVCRKRINDVERSFKVADFDGDIKGAVFRRGSQGKREDP